MRFAGKTVVLCVTGGIAAYKAADLTSKLHQNGATVHVLMTESATQFIAPMTFETLSGNRAVVDTFDRSFPWEVEHISLAKAADVFVIAPATANVIAKAAHGIADDGAGGNPPAKIEHVPQDLSSFNNRMVVVEREEIRQGMRIGESAMLVKRYGLRTTVMKRKSPP